MDKSQGFVQVSKLKRERVRERDREREREIEREALERES